MPMDLRQRPYLLFDGAMGTYYSGRTAAEEGSSCELANLSDAQTIVDIHRSYIQAGAQALRTNTFAANTASLGADLDTVLRVVRAGYRNAVEAARGQEILIFADIGPIPGLKDEEAMQEHRVMIDAFLAEGAAHFIFETWSDAAIPIECARYIKDQLPGAFVLVQFGIMPDGYTRMGKTGESIIQSVRESGVVDAYGFNCVSGPSHLLEYLRKTGLTDSRFSIMPNAGYPTTINHRTVFDISPEYFAGKMLEIHALGVQILGGCCGTTPAHIRILSERLQSGDIPTQAAGVQKRVEQTEIGSRPPHRLRELIASQHKFLAVEMSPPLNTDVADFMEKAKAAKAAGANVITIPDCPIARARMDSGILSVKLKRELGIDVLPHLTCRDRNINAIKAMLLGLSAEGVDNLLLISGDPIPAADRLQIKGVFDFNSRRLAAYIHELNQDIFQSAPFFLAGALNINAANFHHELARAEKKAQAGMELFFTQPVFSEQAAENIRLAAQMLPVPICAGIMPIVSYKNAVFINNEISGIHVPPEIVERFRGKDREACFPISVQTSLEYVRSIYADVSGFYLITPLKRSDIIVELIQEIRRIET